MSNLLIVSFLTIFASCVAVAQAPPTSQLTDADEIHIGNLLAAKMVALEEMQSSPQTLKIEKYLQSVADKVGAQAERKLPYRIHYDPDPGFKSAFGLPGG